MIDEYLEKKYGMAIDNIRRNADILRDILLNEPVSRVLNAFNGEAWDDGNINLFIGKLRENYRYINFVKTPYIFQSPDVLRVALENRDKLLFKFGEQAWSEENIKVFIKNFVSDIRNNEKLYPVLADALKGNILVCRAHMMMANGRTFYNFNREAFNDENYGLLKKDIKEGLVKLPDCFKKDEKILLDFINERLDVDDFDKEAWSDFATDVYLGKAFEIYRLSDRPFSVPRGLYDNEKVFNFLLGKRLLTLDSHYSYSLDLSVDDIEKYVKFLKKNKTFIRNQDNFIKSNLLLRRILEEGLISYVYSFKDEAWDEDNVLLFSKFLEERKLDIPRALINNTMILNICIRKGRNINSFGYGAWNEDNIRLFISMYDGEDIPNCLYSSEVFLSYYLHGSDSSKLCFFKDGAWSRENIELFEKKLLLNPVLPSEFPLAFMFNSEILNFLLRNDLYEYLDLFLSGAWSEENVKLYENLLKINYIDYIPRSLRDSDSLLSFCLQNDLFEYAPSFVSKAWNVSNAKNYVLHFGGDNFTISGNMMRSKNFAITLIMFGFYDKLLDFPIESTPDEYIDILFESIISDKQKYDMISFKYKKIEDSKMKINFRNYIIRNRNNIKNIEDIISIFQNISYSNSSEIKKLSNEISDLVLSRDNPKEEFKRIERLFLSDELPNIAKIYCVFRMFHTDSSGKLWINPYRNISPVLKRYSSLDLERHSLMCEVIIFEDLLKTYAESNNMEFQRYLKVLKFGDELFNKVSSGDDSLSLEEKDTLYFYMRKLTALYNQTLAGKKDNYVLVGNMEEDVKNLISLFKLSDNSERLLDRVVKMYGYFIGINTYDELMERIKYKTTLADIRGRDYEKKPFILEKGDFIKGINDVSFLPNILSNGSLASEFLGYGATEKGDATPLDTDVSMIGEETDIVHLFDKHYVALDYGDTWIVLKKDKVYVTRDKYEEKVKPRYDMNKLEAFYTGILSEDHYGIRTGFASTDIDYLITREYTKEMGFEIARSGFYIPVLDTSGDLVFTSEMYDKIRSQMNGLSYYGVDTFEFSDNLDFPGIDDEIDKLEKSQIEVVKKEKLIRKVISETLREFDLSGNDRLDGNLSRDIYNFVNIGSTGRGTQTEDADFDFMLLLDQSIINDEEKMKKITMAIRSALNDDLTTDLNYKSDIRLKNVHLGAECIDIDISFEGKTDMITYSSDMALKDRLLSMEKASSDKAVLVRANIIKAKEILKDAGVYKPVISSEVEGGLGGAGIENWIMASGGSLIDAFTSFLNAYDEAYNLSETKDDYSVFYEFCQIYDVWNFGENFYALRSVNSLHNEFVSSNMSGTGLRRMANVLRNYIKNLNLDNEKKR